MRVITVCVGSACHLKGSQDIIVYFQQAIKEHGLEKDVRTKGNLLHGSVHRRSQSAH